MLFNSPVFLFLFLFLPLTLAGFYLLARLFGRNAALGYLLFACLVFYAYSSLSNFALFGVSVIANFLLGYAVAQSGSSKRAWLLGGIILNLGLIGYFKYTGLLLTSINQVFSASFFVPHIALPVGISFYTFEQISYLVEARQANKPERSLARYALFVGFFPHLIAGPIIRPHQLLPQFSNPELGRFNWQNFAIGLTFLLLGLFKKVFIADGVAVYASPVFNAAASGGTPGLINAWGAAFAYTFQIYFDFSGYSDMAIGLSLLFGIALPFNFNSPYKATSVIDFWHRWHMTLSMYLRDYVYIPLGGNRCGELRRYLNIMLTMLIGGLWHGANWTFVVWGGLHGIYLLVNHAWRGLRGQRQTGALQQWAGRLVTFMLVVFAWVFFRADNFSAARVMFKGMAGRHGWLNGPPVDAATWLSTLLQHLGITVPEGWPAAGLLQGIWLIGLLAMVWSLPNTQQFLVGEGRPADARMGDRAWPIRQLRPHLQHGRRQPRQRVHLLHILIVRCSPACMS